MNSVLNYKNIRLNHFRIDRISGGDTIVTN